MENEFKKYGEIDKIVIPRPEKWNKNISGEGNVYILFKNENSARIARKVKLQEHFI